MFDLDIQDAVAMVGRLLDSLVAIGSSTGREGSDLRRIVGEKRSFAEDSIRSGNIGQDLLDVFHSARLAGSSLAAMSRVRLALESEAATSDLLSRIINIAILLCLSQESVITSGTEFRSRDDIEFALAQMNSAFNKAEEFAADQKDVEIYRALISLHSSVTKHLVEQSRPLPRIVTFNFPQSMPALVLANRIHGDAGRAAELMEENKTIHPLFMSGRGRALSA